MSLSRNLMRRVYMLWLLRGAVSPFFIKLYLVAVLVWQLILQISFVNVFQNAPGLNQFADSFMFFARAVWNAEFLVQAVLVGLVLFGALIIKDVIGRMGVFSIDRDREVAS